ncbi:MAG: hypothetical protein VX017_03300, partial [Pseudomonadota bacterium]|nr:hypothetical protein [Pseudomonadota bacterium]
MGHHRVNRRRLTGQASFMVLSANELTLGYRGHAVVSNVSFNVAAGARSRRNRTMPPMASQRSDGSTAAEGASGAGSAARGG